MAVYYLNPDIITKRLIRAGGGAMYNPKFEVLALYYNRPLSEFSTNDYIYPSYDGEHLGLLEGYVYTLLGSRGDSPIGWENGTDPWDPSVSPLVISYNDKYITITRRHGTYTDSLDIQKEISGGGGAISFRASFNQTGGLAIAVFSDGGVLWQWINAIYDPENPNPRYTYDPATNSKFGTMIVSLSEEAYTPLELSNAFVVADANKYIGEVLYGKSEVASDDPYDNFPEPTDPGGDGDPESMGPGDAIDIPATPTISAASSGLVTLYNPTIYQLQSLANYLWSGPFDLDSFKKIFADPMDCILGLSIVPVSVPNGAIQPITVGNISTGINVSTAAADYVEIDCGTLSIPHEFKSYLDYAPFTTVDIYLPYIGVRHLDTDNIMPAGGESTRAVKVVYKVDLFSGACIAFIKCGSSVMYSFAGQCATQIPVTGNSWTELYKSIVGVATSAIGSVTSGAGAGTTVSNTYGNAGRVSDVRSHISEMSGRKSTTSSGSTHSASAAAVADAVFSAKPQIDRTGNIGSAVGLLGVQKPYLIIRRPVICVPKLMYQYSPYPSYRIRQIGALSGHAVFEEVHLEHLPATEDEVDEIYSLLESGVII